jgi:hypothetical protein
VTERFDQIVRSLHRIIAHNDLNIQGTATQIPVTDAEEAEWSEYTSQKFYFLKIFLSIAHQEPKRVCIIADEGRLLDIIEVYLRAKDVVHTRPGKPSFETDRIDGELNVDLLSMADLDRSVISKPDLIIAFDISFDANNVSAKRLRGDTAGSRNGKLVPVVHLLAPFTVEHIERSLPRELQGLKRQQALVKATVKYSYAIRLMKNNDDDPESGYPVTDFALQLLNFLQTNEWDGRDMDPLDLEIESDASSPARDLAPPAFSGAQSRSLTPGGQKRSLVLTQLLHIFLDLPKLER